MKLKIIIGLGNPGKKYKSNRHNVGFMLLDEIKKNYDFPDFKMEQKFDAQISFTQNSRLSKALLAKPQTFMNNSGKSVQALINFYKLSPEDILVIHDDIDIILGKYKLATDSSSAGHNGIQNIIDILGTKKFNRIRIGVAGKNYDKKQLELCDFVLQNFEEKEMKTILEDMTSEVMKEIENFCQK
ncbi:MAG: aminoacyl-tRNA hydrolase [Candidatus Moranbacteria bacterium CG08_land_8_20_14_0_20_34_16]|nr:MAG: aminoacyl-tRNA hydrolase [Candidatus Moranbacteria bacterium CG08_land_8_20_14_0_20_34_16]